MTTIVLKPSEYAMAAYLASVREFVNHEFGVKDKQMGNDDGLQISVDGLVAEFGVCKHFNVCPDLSFEPRSGGMDCLIKNKKVDVKSTKFGNTKVFIPDWKTKKDIDIYIYCYVKFRTVEILGWFYKEDIFKDENLEESPKENVNHYVLNIENLRKF